MNENNYSLCKARLRTKDTGKEYIILERLCDVGQDAKKPYLSDQKYLYDSDIHWIYTDDQSFNNGYVGIWKWHFEEEYENKIFSHSSLLKNIHPIEIVNVIDKTFKTAEDLLKQLKEGLESSQFRKIKNSNNNVLLVYKYAGYRYRTGIYLSKNDFEYVSELSNIIRLKNSVNRISIYNISYLDCLEIDDRQIYKYFNFNQDCWVKDIMAQSPIEIVKNIVVERANKSTLEKYNISRIQRQNLRSFFKDIHSDVITEVKDKCACSEKEAEGYVAQFIEQIDKNLEDKTTFASIVKAASNNETVRNAVKEELTNDWQTENQEKIDELNQQINDLTEEKEDLQKTCQEKEKTNCKNKLQ